MTGLARDWPSLAAQTELAAQLYGAVGARRLSDWLALQMARVDDRDFARLFADHITLRGIATMDFAHRLVRTRVGSVLGGIRFLAQDVERPFVEVIAHSFEDRDALRDVVAAQWRDFAPLSLRCLDAPDAPACLGSFVDMTIHAARYGDMTAPDGRVTLGAFERAEDAIDLVRVRYREMARSNPQLAREVVPAGPQDLRDWHADGALQGIRRRGAPADFAGLLAIAPGSVAWLSGDVVMEEVVRTADCGQGLAASAQRVWAAIRSPDPHRLLLGTINGRNIASRKSAERAGRPAVLAYTFVPLPRLS